MQIHTTLDISRTTYFDTLQENGNESGEPSGQLKITEVPGYPEAKAARVAETKGFTNED